MANVFSIFIKSVELYFRNFISFFKYMAFPVFGQLLGLLWILIVSYFYINNLPQLLENKIFNSFSIVFLVLLLITLPGLFVMLKAFWEYLVAYGAINSMLDGLLKSGKIYDFPAHNEVVIRKTPKFIGIWVIISLLTLVCIFPLFWIFGLIFFIYFILVFQVFIFEPDEGTFGCFKRSFEIIKGKFGWTLLLLIFIGVFSTNFLPWLAEKFFDFCKFLDYLIMPIDSFVYLFPIDEINKNLSLNLTSLTISKSVLSMGISFIISGLTLPMRTICWGLWYKKNVSAKSKIDKRILKRAES